MKVQIETQNVVLPPYSQETLVKRVKDALNYAAKGVSSLRLNLRDINGQKGGQDKVCTIHATLVGGGEIVVIDRKAKLRHSLGSALRRAQRIIVQERRKKHARRKGKYNSELTL